MFLCRSCVPRKCLNLLWWGFVGKGGRGRGIQSPGNLSLSNTIGNPHSYLFIYLFPLNGHCYNSRTVLYFKTVWLVFILKVFLLVLISFFHVSDCHFKICLWSTWVTMWSLGNVLVGKRDFGC